MPESYQELSEEEALIGSGKFGMVHRVRRLSDNKVSQSWTVSFEAPRRHGIAKDENQIVACKSIGFRGTDNIKKSAERESAILGRLRHDNVIRQLDVRWLPKQVKIYMDYCQHGSLQDLINQTQK